MPVSVVYDPFLNDCLQNPYPTYAEMREHYPLYHNEERDIYALSRYADVKAAASDWETFTSEESVDLDGSTLQFRPANFVDFSPPQHTEIRGLVRDAFAPKHVRKLEPLLRSHADKLMREFVERGECDIAWEYSSGLPLHIISHVIGMPEEDLPQMAYYLKTVVSRDPEDNMTLPPRAVQAGKDIRAYFTAMAEDRRKNPRDDLMSHLANTRLPSRELEEDEVTGLCFFLFMAGVDNLSGLITNTISAFLEHPDQRRLAVDDPTLVPAAVEETMRWDPPLQMMARTATRDVEYYGEKIPAGGRTVIIWGAANRDHAEWDHAEEWDITRPPKRQLGFGEGVHFCIGAPLARLQSTVAVQTLLKYAPQYAVVGEPERVLKSNIRTFEHLTISLR
ncbi:cytochrome P450 [Actinoplanes bogorensis]|uniref:Cytochrome P450 n=1 Tax=Paractinoplanes bogorensis TaxID=1610840 RepID=A0ABS5Z1R7_9ACTN|nr:cytochrome P450 [Actinoplanes bogorensis]MBU2668899.1 cytochrome P450 [Actinoplanes bogorensis]